MNPFEEHDPPTPEELRAAREQVAEEREDWNVDDPTQLPDSAKQLIKDLRAAGAPDELIVKTAAGQFDDYVSEHPLPKMYLVECAQAHGLPEIAQRAKRGDYDRC